MVTGAIDTSDILRAELVMAVSALDHFIHELVRLGMLEIKRGNRPPSRGYLKFNLTLSSTISALSNPGADEWLDSEIRERHGYRSFQTPKKIAEAVKLISDISLWREVSNHLGKKEDDIKVILNAIIDRRNRIAHEADLDPTAPGKRWPIDKKMVDDAVNQVEEIGVAIYNVV